MNRVGKFLVGAILVMSILFMAISVAVFSTHRNWTAIISRPQNDVKPGEPLGLKLQLAEARQKLDALKKQYENLQKIVQIEDQDRRARMAKMERTRAELKMVY